MNEIAKALYAFWSKFGIPAYASDAVPPNAQLPYIRYDVASAPLMEGNILTAYNYHSEKLMGNVERMEMAGRIADAIPEGGTRIPVDGGGFLCLYRNSPFQSTYQDPEDPDVIGVRTAVEVRYYTM